MVLYSSLVGEVDGNRMHVEFLRIPKPSGFFYQISMKAIMETIHFLKGGKNNHLWSEQWMAIEFM